MKSYGCVFETIAVVARYRVGTISPSLLQVKQPWPRECLLSEMIARVLRRYSVRRLTNLVWFSLNVHFTCVTGVSMTSLDGLGPTC